MFRILTISMAMLLLASCVEEATSEGLPEPGDGAVFIVSAAADSDDAPISVKWEAVKDKVGVFASAEGKSLCSNLCYNAYSSTLISRFVDLNGKNPLLLDEGAVVDLCLYYPFRSSVSVSELVPFSVPQRQKLGGVPDLKKGLMYCSQTATYLEQGTEMQLKPAYSLIKVKLSFDRTEKISELTLMSDSSEPLAFDDGRFDLNTGKFVAGEDDSDRITLSSDRPLAVGTSAADIYFAVSPGHAGAHLTLTALIDEEIMELAVVDVPVGGLRSGYVSEYEISYQLPELREVYLSEHAKANTYIISQADMTYLFDVNVKGNGIQRDFNWTFDGEPCNVSWNDVDIRPADVKVLWYNTPVAKDGTRENVCPISLDSFEYDRENSIVYFDTPENFVEGNVVIAAFSEQNEIIWSWNIWAVEDYNPEHSAKQVGRFTVMDRNLGSFAGAEVATAADTYVAARSIGNYYQWGRKDPMPAASSMTDLNSSEWGMPTYTPLAEYQKTDGRIFTDNREDNICCIGNEVGADFTLAQAVDVSVRNPHKAMMNGTTDNVDPYHWAMPSYSASEKYETTADRTHWRTLWGSIDGYNSVKTIFDPCPPGWKVPTADMFVYVFGDAEKTADGYGYYSEKYDLFMPCAGQRNAGFGGSKLSSVGQFAFYSSATANDAYVPLRAGDSGVSSYNSYGGASYQIRCVREEVSSSAAPVGVQSGHRAVLMGDSITEQWPIRGCKEFFTENEYKGVGISGQTSRDMIARFYDDVLADDPQLVVVAAGTNDLAFNDGVKVSREDICNNVMFMVELARAWGAEVIVGSSFPSRHYWWNYNGTVSKDFWTITPEQTAQRAIELGKLLKAYADSKGYRHADYFSVLKDEQNNLSDPYCWNFGAGWAYAADGLDRVHPNAAGYEEMEKILKPLVDAAINDPDQIDPGDSSIDDLDKVEW